MKWLILTGTLLYFGAWAIHMVTENYNPVKVTMAVGGGLLVIIALGVDVWRAL